MELRRAKAQPTEVPAATATARRRQRMPRGPAEVSRGRRTPERESSCRRKRITRPVAVGQRAEIAAESETRGRRQTSREARLTPFTEWRRCDQGAKGGRAIVCGPRFRKSASGIICADERESAIEPRRIALTLMGGHK